MKKSPGLNRRRFLTVATSAFGSIGALVSLIPFLGSLLPSRRTEAVGAPTKIDISDLAEGEIRTVQWRQKPIWIMRRNQAQIDSIKASEDLLADPNSNTSDQPDFAINPERSLKPEIGVMVALCTHFGCVPVYQEGDTQGNISKFFCPCHSTSFDLAGRVYQNQPAPVNLVVPPYYFESEDVVVIGALSPDNA